MKAKVTLTHTVTVYVEADSEEQIHEWMLQTTPNEALREVQHQNRSLCAVEESYDEEIECIVRDDSEVAIVIE